MITILAYSIAINAWGILNLNINIKVTKLERGLKEISFIKFKRVIDYKQILSLEIYKN